MLTLKRKEGESIVIYNNDVEITIKLTDLTGKSAKVNIEAPPEYKIHRQEMLEGNN